MVTYFLFKGEKNKMKDNIKRIIASIVLLGVITGATYTASTISQDSSTTRSKEGNENKNIGIEQVAEKDSISSEDLFVIDTESSANLCAINTQRYYVLRKTNMSVPASDHEKQESLIFVDIFNDGADAYVWEDLSSYNYCDYSKEANAVGTKTELDPALIPYEQFLRENGLESYISTTGTYSEEELTTAGQAMGILEKFEKKLMM